MNRKKVNEGYSDKTLLKGIAIAILPFFLFIAYVLYHSEKSVVPLSIFVLLAGVFIESKRLSKKWSTVFYKFLAALVISVFSFLPFSDEINYNIENHVTMWIYVFLLAFLLISLAFHREKIKLFLSEGVTLNLSVGIIYWLVENEFYNTTSVVIKSAASFFIIVAFFTIINTFSRFKLTPTTRLLLSIWSSIVLMFLALDNILNLLNYQIEGAFFLVDKAVIVIQYFFLGISSIYILLNIFMLMEFLPDRSAKTKKEHIDNFNAIKLEHINRYSENKISKKLALICLVVSIVFYSSNYLFQFLPTNAAIWLMLFFLNNLVYFNESDQSLPYTKNAKL